MKKITFYKSMSNGEFIKATGYYYKATNGFEVALHDGGNGWHWRATELRTGYGCPILGAKTLRETAQQIKAIADEAKKISRQIYISTRDYRKTRKIRTYNSNHPIRLNFQAKFDKMEKDL